MDDVGLLVVDADRVRDEGVVLGGAQAPDRRHGGVVDPHVYAAETLDRRVGERQLRAVGLADNRVELGEAIGRNALDLLNQHLHAALVRQSMKIAGVDGVALDGVSSAPSPTLSAYVPPAT